MILLFLACRPSPEAPEAIDDLSRYLAANVTHEDDGVVLAGLAQLEAHLAGVDMEGSLVDERSWLLGPLTDTELEGRTHPDRDLDATINIGIVGAEAHDLDDHLPYMMWADQTPLNSGIQYYTREFPDTGDGDCFVDKSCPQIQTFNHAIRENHLYTVYYESLKDWRLIDLGDDRQAVVALAWFEESWPTTAGKDAHLWQSYELDVWLEPQGEEGVWRYYVGWSESDLSEGEDVVAGSVRSATETRYETEESAAAGEL
ncbi:MAG: hypothetical protein GY913_06205 [Proteobacteria bacterium]|nr:hypothetical protein [Pseudomonadota bacterium]MCP4916499.1 hypothetical protein [Pseudomonadota bacterium]